MTTDPTPTPPRFQLGDPVWAFNGEPRIITGMRWTTAMKRGNDDVKRGAATALDDPGAPNRYGWAIDSVHPDNPKCTGTGFEEVYRPRADGEPSPGMMPWDWEKSPPARPALEEPP